MGKHLFFIEKKVKENKVTSIINMNRTFNFNFNEIAFVMYILL